MAWCASGEAAQGDTRRFSEPRRRQRMKRLTIWISGSGSNCRAVIAAVARGQIAARIDRVVADRECGGKTHAFAAGIPFVMIDRRLTKAEFSRELVASIAPETDLIVLAGFLSIVPDALLTAFPDRIINIHPSLLPKFGGAGMYGIHVHRAVLAAGETESGCTVHYVTDVVDGGAVIAQRKVPVLAKDTPETLQKRVLKEEHELLVDTIAELLS